MMSLFFEKFRVWFGEAALVNHVEYGLKYDGFQHREHSFRVVLLTVLTVVWLVVSFPFNAYAEVEKAKAVPFFYDDSFERLKADAQSFEVGDVAVQEIVRDNFSVSLPVEPEKPKFVVPSGPVGSPTEAQAYAQSLVGSGDEWACLYNLWARESGWRVEAHNQSSGAYGIPQALPGSKMASAGADWESSYITQVNWGLGYINGRYGSPCGAWAHSESVGWY